MHTALTVAEYDTLSNEMKGKAAELIVNDVYKEIIEEHGADKAQRIIDLFQTVNTDQSPRGVRELVLEINRARTHNPSLRVEDIAADVLMRECVDD